MFNIGDRVINKGGEIGIIESRVEDGFIDVRLLTPRNKPSCCVSMCTESALIKIPDYVIPMRRSRAWEEESRLFCAAIEDALTGIE